MPVYTTNPSITCRNNAYGGEHARYAMADALPTPVLLCEHALDIRYANDASMAAFAQIEEALPVSLSRIMGSAIDIFWPRDLLLAQPHRTHTCWLSPYRLWLRAHMLRNARGEFDGLFIDWNIVTALHGAGGQC